MLVVCNIRNNIMKMLDALGLGFSKTKGILVDVYVREISFGLQVKWMFLMQFILIVYKCSFQIRLCINTYIHIS